LADFSPVQLRREEYGGLRANRGGAAADGEQRLISELFLCDSLFLSEVFGFLLVAIF
jgi:hypothetical protein